MRPAPLFQNHRGFSSFFRQIDLQDLYITLGSGLSSGQSLVFPYEGSGIQGPPLALLSQGNATINGLINVSAPAFPISPQLAGNTGGPGGFGSGAGPGAGGTGGEFFPPGIQAVNTAGGGGFGGSGGNGDRVNAIVTGMGLVFQVVPGGGAQGGSSYGNLAVSLQGESGGGNYSYPGVIGYGGGGGGAIEIGATGKISVEGSILANGTSASGGSNTGSVLNSAGGGSGGGIFLHGASVTLSSSAVLRRKAAAAAPSLTNSA